MIIVYDRVSAVKLKSTVGKFFIYEKKSGVGDLKVNFSKFPLTAVTLICFSINMKAVPVVFNIFGDIKAKLLRQEITTGSALN